MPDKKPRFVKLPRQVTIAKREPTLVDYNGFKEMYSQMRVTNDEKRIDKPQDFYRNIVGLNPTQVYELIRGLK